MQAATNVESLSDEGVLDAQFLRELVALGFEVARLNPSVTLSDSGGIEQWLSILWSGEGDLRQAQGGLAQLFDQLSSPSSQLEQLTLQDQLERLKFSTQLVKTVQLVDDPEVKLLAQSLEHLGYLLDLGSSYAVLKPAGAKAGSTEASFLTLVAQGDLQAAANELERLIQQALDTIQYTGEITVTTVITDEGEKVLVGRTLLSNGIVTPLGFNLRDDDPANDRYPIAYQVQRADGTIEPPVPGDTLFRVYLNQGDVTGLQPGEVALYPGDVVLYPTQSEDPFGSDRLRNLASRDYNPMDKMFDAMRLAPYMAGPQIAEQINDFLQVVKDHPLVAGFAVGGVLGGIAAAQFVQPVGVILDVGLILLAGWEAGFSFGSFLFKAANAQSQADLWDASSELVKALTALATNIPLGGLLKLEPANGLLNTLRLLNKGEELLREINRVLNAGELRSISDLIAIPLSMFRDSDTAVARLLQYGTEQVTAFLRGGFDQFEGGLPTIEGLTDFAERFRRVSEVAERLDQLDAATVTRWLSEHPSAVGNILEFNPADAANAALIDRLNQTIPGRFSPENLVAISMRNNPSEPTIKVLPRGADPFNPDNLVEIEGPVFLEIGTNTRTTNATTGLEEDKGGGLVHILAAHATDFTNQGIPEDRIVDAVVAAVTKGTDVGSQGRRVDRRIYEVNLGEALGIPGLGVKRIAVTVGDNGFIVGANPVSF